MSTTAPGGPGAPEEERKGLSKFVRRASKVFRRRSSARASISGPSNLAQAPSGAAANDPSAAQVASPAPIAETAIEEQPITTLPAPTSGQQTAEPTLAKPANLRLATTAADSSVILEERARALFAKYGLTLEPGEWTSPIKPDAERVEKKIRMRIHRVCHHCQTTFGPDKICNHCKHPRCKKCPRYCTSLQHNGCAELAMSVTLSSKVKRQTAQVAGTFDVNDVHESRQRETNIQRATPATAITI
ncbi:MAG: hypothetical protein Q9172_005867 [Xanthocarpia lactea]